MKKFKAESQKVLDIMINSIYTNKDVFLRELISNASDAIDKLYYSSFKEKLNGFSREDFFIKITANEKEKTITISDNGCGMNDKDLEDNLGVIAHSGSQDFKNTMDKTDDINIIGQFGVGFYSAFMISKKVEVITKKYDSATAYKWSSNGAEGFSIAESEKAAVGTDIILYIKDDCEDEKYGEYLSTHKLESLIKKYSDYIRYPIMLLETEKVKKEDTENEYEEKSEYKTVNSMIPIWKKNKAEVTDEEYNTFYNGKFFDYKAPIKTIRSSVEGNVNFTSLLFVPSEAPYNFYSKEFEKGLQLYSKGVLIMDRCAELLPDYFSFIKGIVDTEDIALNISREVLQHNRVLKVIASSLEKKIKSELSAMLLDEREKYESFFKNFGLQLKFGIYNNFGSKNELLQDLLLFHSLKQDKLITLDEYVAAMKEGQKDIYYACGKTISAIKNLPQIDAVLEKDYDILCFVENIDEFISKALFNFKEKSFKSVQDKDLNLGEDKPLDSELQEKNKDLLTFMKEAIGDSIEKVVISSRLKNHPICLSSEGEISIEMEKMFRDLPNAEPVKAKKVLEINSAHPIFLTLNKYYNEDKEKAKNISKVLYSQALLIEGLPIENPLEFTDAVSSLII